MKYQDLLQQINKNKIAPVYFFYGEEEFLKREALLVLYGKLVTEDQKDFNYVLLYGKEVSAGTLIDQCQALPFLADRRLVVVQEIEKFQDKAKLLSYIEQPNPSTCLVLVAGKLDNRSRKTEFYSALKEYEVVFWPLFQNELKKWVEQKFRSYQKAVDLATVDYLIEAVGPNLASLDSEINKLVVSLPADKRVTLVAAQKNVFRSYSEHAVRLEKAVAGRELDRALLALQDLFAEGGASTQALWIISQSWRRLLIAKEMQSQQASPSDILKKFNIRKFDEQREFAENLPKFNLAELLSKHKKIADTDKAIKNGLQNPLWALEHLLIDLCG